MLGVLLLYLAFIHVTDIALCGATATKIECKYPRLCVCVCVCKNREQSTNHTMSIPISDWDAGHINSHPCYVHSNINSHPCWLRDSMEIVRRKHLENASRTHTSWCGSSEPSSAFSADGGARICRAAICGMVCIIVICVSERTRVHDNGSTIKTVRRATEN
jgi:hypothetical protein